MNFGLLLGILAVIVSLYSFWYYVHFSYLPLSGEHGDAFMPIEFQRKLINSKHYDVSAMEFLLITEFCTPFLLLKYY